MADSIGHGSGPSLGRSVTHIPKLLLVMPYVCVRFP
jgi:hypothetical protein